MALITFLSDFGRSDHYVAAVKAAVLQVDPSLQIIDISHEIEPFDLAHAAHVLGAVFRDFPENTIHLVAIEAFERRQSRYLALNLENHLFLGPDCGLFSLISDKQPKEMVALETKNLADQSFIARSLLAPLAGQLATGKTLQSIGEPTADWVRRINRQVKANKRLIAGHIVRVDHYGNLITNIEKFDFDKILEINQGKPFEVQLGRERSNVIHNHYNDVDPGDCFYIFNHDGKLEIGINQGNASKLLGLHYDSPVNIHFT